MSTGPINNSNPYLQQILAQNLSSTNIQPKQLKNSTQLLSSANSAKTSISTISSSGSKINKISSQIRESGDFQAFSGFQATLQKVSNGSDPLKTVRLVNSASYLANTSPEALNQTFSTANRLSDQYGSGIADTYVNSLISTTEKARVDGVNSLNNAVAAVEGADYSASRVGVKDNLEGLLSSVREVNFSGGTSEEVGAELNRLARGVELAGSADSIWNFFNDFTGSNPDAEPA